MVCFFPSSSGSTEGNMAIEPSLNSPFEARAVNGWFAYRSRVLLVIACHRNPSLRNASTTLEVTLLFFRTTTNSLTFFSLLRVHPKRNQDHGIRGLQPLLRCRNSTSSTSNSNQGRFYFVAPPSDDHLIMPGEVVGRPRCVRSHILIDRIEYFLTGVPFILS